MSISPDSPTTQGIFPLVIHRLLSVLLVGLCSLLQVCPASTERRITPFQPTIHPSFLEENHIAYDINSYRDAPIGIRIWGGATVNEKDIDILLDWLEWCFIKFIRE